MGVAPGLAPEQDCHERVEEVVKALVIKEMEVEVGTAVVIVAMGAVAAKALGSRAMAAEGIPVVMVNPPVDSAACTALQPREHRSQRSRCHMRSARSSRQGHHHHRSHR